MKKNYLLCLRLETEVLEKLKKQANEEDVTVSELCRKKLGGCTRLDKIEMILEELSKKLNVRR
jgi:hypothetical protein